MGRFDGVESGGKQARFHNRYKGRSLETPIDLVPGVPLADKRGEPESVDLCAHS